LLRLQRSSERGDPDFSLLGGGRVAQDGGNDNILGRTRKVFVARSLEGKYAGTGDLLGQ
jgi:hypothetical protein